MITETSYHASILKAYCTYIITKTECPVVQINFCTFTTKTSLLFCSLKHSKMRSFQTFVDFFIWVENQWVWLVCWPWSCEPWSSGPWKRCLLSLKSISISISSLIKMYVIIPNPYPMAKIRNRKSIVLYLLLNPSSKRLRDFLVLFSQLGQFCSIFAKFLCVPWILTSFRLAPWILCRSWRLEWTVGAVGEAA